MTDPSGLVPSQKWLANWDREIFNYMTASDGTRPAVLFPLDTFRAVMKHMSNHVSLVGRIPGIDE